MAINLQSLSLTSAFSAIINFLRGQENREKWKDLTTSGGEGTFLIRMLANIFSTLSYRIVAQSRENYLSTAILRSSNIGIAVNLGYSVFRGSNLKRLIEIIPDGNYTFPKYSQIGTYNDLYNIYVYGYEDSEEPQDVDVEEGKPVVLKTIVGVAKETTFIAGTDSVKCFTLFTNGISEDFVLYKGSEEVPTTNVIKRMTDDKYLVRTNPYSSVDVMYLNNKDGAKYTYGTGTEFTLRYIELADVPEVPYTDGMFAYGTLTNYRNISSYLPFESIEETKVKAPLDHETQNLIRSKQDYANRMRISAPNVISSEYYAVTPTYTQITYLKNDYTLLTEDEEVGVLNLLKEENYFGTPLPDITHPRREVAHLKISLALTNKYKNISDINLDIENILESYYDAKLKSTFSTYDLERKIEALSYVKYARVSHIINERNPNTTYQIGYMITRDGITYMASKILGHSGDTTPAWNVKVDPPTTIATDWITIDGNLKWRTYKRLPNMPYTEVYNHRVRDNYGIGDFVYSETYPNYMFKCIDIIKNSGFSAPDLTLAEAGDFFVDGGLVWVAKKYNSTYNNWVASTTYTLGDSVNVPSNSELSLECVSYVGETSPDESLTFEQLSYNIETQGTNTFVLDGDCSYYFRTNDVISATYEDRVEKSTTFSVLSSSYDSLETKKTTITVDGTIDAGIHYNELYVVSRGTKDGGVMWSIVKDPDNITYPWNGYVTFDHTLEIIE